MGVLISTPYDDENAFGAMELTAGINFIQPTYGLLLPSGLFNPVGVSTKTISIEMVNNQLQLLETKPEDGDANLSTQEERSMVTFKIPHIPLRDTIRPSEFSGIRAFGGTELDHAHNVMEKKSLKNRRRFELTWEHLMWGALKGEIIDGDGSRVLFNLYDKFEVTKKVIDFELHNPKTDVDGKCEEIVAHVERYLQGDTMTEVVCRVSPEFFRLLITHPNVEKFYLAQSGAAKLVGASFKAFVFGNVRFEVYRGQAPTSKGVQRRFINPGEGIAYPEGTYETFGGAWGPGEFMDTVNTEGIPIYARRKVLDFDKGLDLYYESNPIFLCMRPQVLVTVTAGEEFEIP
ncbi:major capsid protein [Maridesulfovibrio ferrireducens]|uniref:major capsid protein n=1 Tax=Maridesulfovibrio ferrireducens TaxID=246191 RepID=UPI001A1E7DA8|nr:major capsid protein [Maridesulfovibrio ferrireducens]MBI9112257.1 major capsid protein [Maridesulfovibrio ferrireducens]